MNFLIIVDVQNDFVTGSLKVNNAQNIIEKINLMTESNFFDVIIATRDWHPEKHISFESRYEEPIRTDKKNKGIAWPDHCIAGTKGAEFVPELNTSKFSMIINKGLNKDLDSYSAIFENDGETETPLFNYFLNKLQINDNIYVCGIATEVCVKATVQDLSLFRLANVILVKDAIASLSHETEEVTLKELKKIANISKVEDIIR